MVLKLLSYLNTGTRSCDDDVESVGINIVFLYTREFACKSKRMYANMCVLQIVFPRFDSIKANLF